VSSGPPQQHLTRDQFQSLSGLGNETSQVSSLASITEGGASFSRTVPE
jgi:hypothetical protein